MVHPSKAYRYLKAMNKAYTHDVAFYKTAEHFGISSFELSKLFQKKRMKTIKLEIVKKEIQDIQLLLF